MKNKTLFITLLFAKLVLLAHTFVPHHIFTDYPLEIEVECNNQEELSIQQETPFYNIDHQDHEASACSLTHTMVTRNNQFRKIFESVDLKFTNILFFAVPDFYYSLQSNYCDKPPEVLENTFLYSRLLVSSQGLRAPPAC